MHHIHEHFSKTVDDYDYVADRVVFENNALHEQLVKYLPFHQKQAVKVLDLGCGTGHGMRAVLEHFPRAVVTGIDFSERMVKKCEARVANFSSRARVMNADFTKIGLGSGYDAVLSAVAIHNIPHEDKKVVFERIFAALVPGGVFLNGDFVEGETQKTNAEFQKVYRAFLEKNLSGRELQVWLKHAFEEDKPAKLSEQFVLLRQAGFEEPRIVWEFVNEAVYVAKKPERKKKRFWAR